MQIRGVVSEALEAKIRELFPSQNGFTEELEAQNLIVPTVDLTRAAEGSDVPEYLQRAWDFGTAFYTTVGAATSTVANTTGFWQFALSVGYNHLHTSFPQVYITDGVSDKVIWTVAGNAAVNTPTLQTSDRLVAFLKSGESLVLETFADQKAGLWIRQIADVNGTLANPLGFTPQ